MKKILVSLLFVASIGLVNAQDYSKWIGKPLPKFSFKTTDGKTVNNTSIKGKAMLLDFWATWCGPCKKASPDVEAFHKQYSSKGLFVVGATFQDAAGSAKKYKAEHKYSFAFAEDATKLGESLGVRAIPTFVVVDKNGIIREMTLGFNKPKIEAALKNLMK